MILTNCDYFTNIHTVKSANSIKEDAQRESKIDRLIEDVENIDPQLSTISETIPNIESRILLINEKIVTLAETVGKKLLKGISSSQKTSRNYSTLQK